MKTALCLLFLGAIASPAKTFFTHEQALKSAFGAKVETSQKSHYWNKKQRARLAELVGVEKLDQVRSFHTHHQANQQKGKAANLDTVWFDKRIVRTKAQEIMLVVDDKGVVKDLVVCVFDEPLKYKPSAKWYCQFEGLDLDDELQLKKEIHGISGATLTARSTTAAVRELLGAAQVAREVQKAAERKITPPK